MSSAKSGGSERRKIDAQPVIQLETVSPDGRWAVAQVAIQNEDMPRGILAIPLEGGTPIRICGGLCVVRWPLDGKSMFLSVSGGSPGHMLGWGTYRLPLAPGQVFPKLPPMGVASKADAAALPGAKSLDTRQEWLAEMAAASRFAEARSTLPNTSRRELKL